jgi:hypothetical protein
MQRVFCGALLWPTALAETGRTGLVKQHMTRAIVTMYTLAKEKLGRAGYSRDMDACHANLRSRLYN